MTLDTIVGLGLSLIALASTRGHHPARAMPPHLGVADISPALHAVYDPATVEPLHPEIAALLSALPQPGQGPR